MEEALQTHGAPRHLISDQGSILTGKAFAEELKKWNIQHRLGAIGQHGSIAVTERLIKTLNKYEWLFRVLLIKRFDWLTGQCEIFQDWYTAWRPHYFLKGATPDEVFLQRPFVSPPKHAKTIPPNIEVKVYPETKVTAYRLKKAA